MLAEILVPITFFIFCFGVVYVVITARNKERMAMIENGADPKLFRPDPRYRTFITLTAALFLIGIGVGVFAGNLIENYTSLDEESGYFSMIALFGGLGLLVSFLIRKRIINEERSTSELD